MMKSKVELIHITPLSLISNGIRYSHDNHDKSDTDKLTNKNVCPKCGGDMKIYADDDGGYFSQCV
jgi:ssDNA-binding Zn-finger/Zn-ribbon topoisomerase 1